MPPTAPAAPVTRIGLVVFMFRRHVADLGLRSKDERATRARAQERTAEGTMAACQRPGKRRERCRSWHSASSASSSHPPPRNGSAHDRSVARSAAERSATRGKLDGLREEHMKFTALLASLCITLASCAAPLTQEQHGEIHSIAVISLLRDRISLEKGSLFAGFAETVPVAGIGFDAVAENSLIECAKIASPKRTYKVIDIPKQPLMDKLYGGVLSAYNATMWRIRPDISEWAKQNPVDAMSSSERCTSRFGVAHRSISAGLVFINSPIKVLSPRRPLGWSSGTERRWTR